MTVLYTRWRSDNYTQKPIFTYQNFFEKICETLFTFKLSSADLLSIWRDFFYKKQNITNFSSAKNYEKIRETLFTFKLQLHSFWRDFSREIQTSNFGLFVTKTTSSGNFR